LATEKTFTDREPNPPLAGDYQAVLGIVLDRVRALSPPEQAQILGGTCTEFYRLDPRAS